MAQLKTRFSGLLVLACVLALLVASAAPALAHHKDDHSQGGDNFQEADKNASDNDGDADSDSSSTQTENDSDPRESDPEDQADDGDNAHPSGKDRSVENGKSTKNPNQGKAESNPDDSKGPQRFEGGRGDDKPNGPGGVDAADQDGNNGCGNDDDFDDDNNGHCGPRVKPTSSPPPTVGGNRCPSNPALPMNHPDCDVVRGGGDKRCPTDSSLPMNHPDCDKVEDRGSVLCPAGTDNAGKPMDSVESCNEDDVEGRVDESNPTKVCPSGPYKGMPFMDEEDCEVASGGDRVSPSRIVRGAVAGTVDAGRRAARAVGAALPFTGAGDIVVIAGLALLLIAGGAMALRTRSMK